MRDTAGGTPPAQRNGFESEEGNGHGVVQAELESSEAVLRAPPEVPQRAPAETGVAPSPPLSPGPSEESARPTAAQAAEEPGESLPSDDAGRRLARWVEEQLAPPAPPPRCWRLREQPTLDYYRILRVSPVASSEAIAAAHFELQRRLARDASRYQRSRERLRQIEAAYEVLSDPARRAAYERLRVARYVVEPSPADQERAGQSGEASRPRLGLSDRVLPLFRARDGRGMVGYVTLCNLGDGSIHGRAVARAAGVTIIPHVFNFTDTLTLMVRVDPQLARGHTGALLEIVTDAGTASLLAPWRPSRWRRVWAWLRRRPRAMAMPHAGRRRRALLEVLGMVSVVALSLLAAGYAMNLLTSTLLLPSQVQALRNLGRAQWRQMLAIDHLSAPYPLDRSAWIDLREQLVLPPPTPAPTAVPAAEAPVEPALALELVQDQQRVEVPPRLVPALQTPLASGPPSGPDVAEWLRRGSTPLDRASAPPPAEAAERAPLDSPRLAAVSPLYTVGAASPQGARAAVAAISPVQPALPTRVATPTVGPAAAEAALAPSPPLEPMSFSLRDIVGWRERFAGSVAEVSNPRPRQYSEITARLRLVRDGQPVAGAPVYFLVHYRTVQERWPGEGYVTTNGDGVAEVTFNVENATRRYTVRVEALAEVEGRRLTFVTAFTPP